VCCVVIREKRTYLEEVLLRVGGVELSVTDLAKERNQVLDALVILVVGYALCRWEFEEEGGYLRHFAAASRKRQVHRLRSCVERRRAGVTALATIVASYGLWT
jgi:hypothetical protein